MDSYIFGVLVGATWVYFSQLTNYLTIVLSIATATLILFLMQRAGWIHG